MSEKIRKRELSYALARSKPGEIVKCDGCDAYCLAEEVHNHTNQILCFECDLPPKWHSRYSDKHKRRYFVFFDPLAGSSTSYVKWGHPTKGNPLYREGDIAQFAANEKKRKHVDS